MTLIVLYLKFNIIFENNTGNSNMLLENLINTDHGVRGDRLAVVLTLSICQLT
jgi:hypothetical protein